MKPASIEMSRNAKNLSVDVISNERESSSHTDVVVQWSWDVEHADRRKEAKADAALHGATPFEVDRRVLKDVVREKSDMEVGRIEFLSSGECAVCFSMHYLIPVIRDFSQGAHTKA